MIVEGLPPPDEESSRQHDYSYPHRHVGDPDLAECVHLHWLLIRVTESSDGASSKTSLHLQTPSSWISINTPTIVNSFKLVNDFRADDRADFPYPSSPGSIVARLSCGSQKQGLAVRFLSVPVRGGGAEVLLLSDDVCPVWKWTKLESSYELKSGYWTTKCEEMLTGAEYGAGKGFGILLTGVSQKDVGKYQSRRIVSGTPGSF
ncbi:hypothetical protein MMC15_007503 [Xylographa vitiligo]|nr:hypothetical protein [Xylographa vitiligo]